MSTTEDSCLKCGGTLFRRVTDEWMKRSIPWTADGVVRQCEACGEKQFVCPKCRGLFTRVNITNFRLMRATCAQCGVRDERIQAWLSEQLG